MFPDEIHPLQDEDTSIDIISLNCKDRFPTIISIRQPAEQQKGLELTYLVHQIQVWIQGNFYLDWSQLERLAGLQPARKQPDTRALL